jgi:hypothetical protein
MITLILNYFEKEKNVDYNTLVMADDYIDSHSLAYPNLHLPLWASPGTSRSFKPIWFTRNPPGARIIMGNSPSQHRPQFTGFTGCSWTKKIEKWQEKFDEIVFGFCDPKDKWIQNFSFLAHNLSKFLSFWSNFELFGTFFKNFQNFQNVCFLNNKLTQNATFRALPLVDPIWVAMRVELGIKDVWQVFLENLWFLWIKTIKFPSSINTKSKSNVHKSHNKRFFELKFFKVLWTLFRYHKQCP